MLVVLLHEAVHRLERAVAREAEVAYPACLFLFEQVVHESQLIVQVPLNVLFGDRVE